MIIKKPVLIGNEYRSGHTWKEEGVSFINPNAQYLPAEITKDLGLGNLFRILGDFVPFTKGTIHSLLKGGDSIIVDFFRCHQKSIDLVVEEMGKFPHRIWGCLFGELDSGCPWEKHKGFFSSKKEAADWFKEFVSNEQSQIGGRKIKGKKIKNILKQGAIKKLKLPLVAHCAMPFSIQYYYQWGFPFVWLERNCWLDNTQIGILFLRGLAKQYGGMWGLDFSPWGGITRIPTSYNRKGIRLGGITESLLLRQWITAFFPVPI